LTIPLDLGRPRAAAEVKARLDQEGIRVRLLCNNAGVGYWGGFETASADAYEDMNNLNTCTVMSLCWHLLPGLSSHPTSAVINISSQAAFQPMPFMAVYAATKAFIHSFSQALYEEWKDRGVLVQTLVPGPTQSAIQTHAAIGKARVKVDLKDPAEVVGVSLAHLAGDHPVVSNVRGLFRQRLFAALAPSKLTSKVVARLFRPSDGGRGGQFKLPSAGDD
jgi:short-subunit dehydrogenase